MARKRRIRIGIPKNSSKYRVSWYRSNIKPNALEDAEHLLETSRSEKYHELFKSLTVDYVDKIEKLIVNLISDSKTSICRNENSYELNYDIENKDESYINVMLFRNRIDVVIRITDNNKIDTEFHYDFFEKFEKRLDNLYIAQELKKMDSCLSEFYNMTSLDRKDKIKKMLE